MTKNASAANWIIGAGSSFGGATPAVMCAMKRCAWFPHTFMPPPQRGRCAAASMTNLIVKDRKQRRRMLLLTNLTPDDEAGPDYNPLVFAT
jgi:hypothetical protein